MREMMSDNPSAQQIKLIRKYLKLKVMEDNVTFRNYSQERHHIYDLMKRTVVHGESHSALMIGPRGCGKSTLINSVLHQLSSEVDLLSDCIIVKLNGLVHHDDKISLKAITAQMQLENAVGDRVFGTFAENLAFLLSCLQSGTDRRCKSMLFILEEFDMFCHSGRTQTLLYNLFDITHSKQAPMCVLGITNRIDVMELLEKRVKSRFSHRHIFMFPAEGKQSVTQGYVQLFVNLLSMPSVGKKRRRKKSTANLEDQMDTDQEAKYSIPEPILLRCKIDQQFKELNANFIEDWNAHVKSLAEEDKIIDVIEKFCYYCVDEQVFRNVLFQIISKLSPTKPYIDCADVISTIDKTIAPEHRVKMLLSLSILELSLVIAMMHGMKILDGQPMNFEMILHRYTKFATANSSTQTVPRPVILKALEHLQALEIITSPVSDSGDCTTSRVQKEYKLLTLPVPTDDIKEALKQFTALPTEINHWFHNIDI